MCRGREDTDRRGYGEGPTETGPGTDESRDVPKGTEDTLWKFPVSSETSEVGVSKVGVGEGGRRVLFRRRGGVPSFSLPRRCTTRGVSDTGRK